VPAAAYVRSRAPSGAGIAWADPRVTLKLSEPPDTFSLDAGEIAAATWGALGAWSAPDCTGLSLTLAPERAASQKVGRDHTNRLVIRTGAWCRDPDALTGCHDHSQVAITTLFLRNNPGQPDDGRILEADIEINSIDFAWAVIPDGPVSGRDYLDKLDLGSVVTHEVGHFVGLAHTCLGPDDEPITDDRGEPVLACGNAPSEVRETTMYPFTDPVDVRQRTLTADDARAACEIYRPLPNDDPVAGFVGPCTVGGAPAAAAGAPPLAMLAAAAAVACLRRRPRRGRRQHRRPH
jgi:hypothetical protein